MNHEFSNEEYWRSIILYGHNVATYKIALAKCLYEFTKVGKTHISMGELSEEFFNQYFSRLTNGLPQMDNPARQTKMEYIIKMYNHEKVNKDFAIRYIQNNAFGDVVPRFHNVNGEQIPISFYQKNSNGIILTDNIFEVFNGYKELSLINEVDSRWGLLEAAFMMKRNNSTLSNNIREFYLSNGYERKNITGTIPVLNGYQKGICFYCGESMEGHTIHVDHVIPRQVIYHDEVWNLVLSHGFCNQQKSDSLPSRKYINKLIQRNEHFIASNHPIKNDLIQALGATVNNRRKFVEKIYDDVKLIIPYTWEGIKGYNPETDPFYKSFIRSLRKW